MARKKVRKTKTPLKTAFLENLFISGLRQEPGALCATGLAGCVEKLFKDSRRTGRADNALRAGMQFLGGDRSAEELRTLNATITQCHCDLEDPLVASLHETALPDPLEFVVTELCTALGAAIPSSSDERDKLDESVKELDRHVDSNEERPAVTEDWEALMEAEDQLGPLPADWLTPEAKPEAPPAPATGPWPSTPADISPSAGGPAQTIANLLAWPATHTLFRLLALLGKHSPAFEAALSSTPRTSAAALACLEHALTLFEAGPSSPSSPPAPTLTALAATAASVAQLFTCGVSMRRLVALLRLSGDTFLAV